MKHILCREHGGTFSITPRRGRPPVRCSEDNPCDQNRTLLGGLKKHPKPVAEARSSASKVKATPAPASVHKNPSVPFAHKAQTELTPLGWILKGKAGFVDGVGWAEVVATRGVESIILRWEDGKKVTQEYSIWDSESSPEQNGRPKSQLRFDPNEMTDLDLARELSGRTITWWNRLANNTDKAVIGEKLEIQHCYTGGNETARFLRFIDQTEHRGSYRAVHVEALIKAV